MGKEQIDQLAGPGELVCTAVAATTDAMVQRRAASSAEFCLPVRVTHRLAERGPTPTVPRPSRSQPVAVPCLSVWIRRASRVRGGRDWLVEVGEDRLEHPRVVNAGEDPNGTAAALAGLDVEAEYPLQPRCPALPRT